MTEAQAWWAERTGLCLEMYELLRAIDHPMRRTWSYDNPRIHKHLGRYAYAYAGPAWEARCLAAYWLALECEEEARHA